MCLTNFIRNKLENYYISLPCSKQSKNSLMACDNRKDAIMKK